MIPDIPATKTACPTASLNRGELIEGLTLSLACYVSEDDASLNRKEFLLTVISRITADLDANEF